MDLDQYDIVGYLETAMEGMSAEEMRNALYERLHNKGLLDLLKVGLTKCFMLTIVFRMFCSNRQDVVFVDY